MASPPLIGRLGSGINERRGLFAVGGLGRWKGSRVTKVQGGHLTRRTLEHKLFHVPCRGRQERKDASLPVPELVGISLLYILMHYSLYNAFVPVVLNTSHCIYMRSPPTPTPPAMIYCSYVGARAKVKSDGSSSPPMLMCLSELGKLLTGGELSAGSLLHLLYFLLPSLPHLSCERSLPDR